MSFKIPKNKTPPEGVHIFLKTKNTGLLTVNMYGELKSSISNKMVEPSETFATFNYLQGPYHPKPFPKLSQRGMIIKPSWAKLGSALAWLLFYLG